MARLIALFVTAIVNHTPERHRGGAGVVTLQAVELRWYVGRVYFAAIAAIWFVGHDCIRSIGLSWKPNALVANFYAGTICKFADCGGFGQIAKTD